MKLARIFQDGMTLQRKKPVKVWGESSKKEQIEVKVNGQVVCTPRIEKGEFEFYIPEQDTMENAVLEIGSLTFENVDFGEVWIAGGQSNMEFLLKYDAEGEGEIESANDEHLRMYDVAKYAFFGAREEQYKDETYWERWMTFHPKDAPEFSAVGLYFAKELRKYDIPVAIVGCTWGGTTAATWVDKGDLLQDDELQCYVTEYEELVSKLDIEKYNQINRMVRHGMENPQAKTMMDHILKNTVTLKEWEQMQQAQNQSSDMPEGVSMEELMVMGPNDKNRPGALYQTMLSEIAGYTAQGVIWYQGESDENKAGMYAKLFTSLITCWREKWGVELPFLYVQIAPFGTWFGNTSENYPLLRRQQELVSERVANTYMITSSDMGNEFDIHPKEKKPIGHRLALCAKAVIYGEEIQWESPKASEMTKDGDILKIAFEQGEGLHIKGEALQKMEIQADEKEIMEYTCQVIDTCLCIQSEEFREASNIQVKFAETGYYKVNLYNKAEVPARPFTLSHYSGSKGS